MNSNLNTLRDYLTVIFRHKTVILTTFVTVMISVIIGLELKTPFYVAHVKMLISAQKQIDSPYYRYLAGYEQIGVSLTQCEILTSNPVIERAVKALKFYERPSDYEKNYCSALKARLIDLKRKIADNPVIERTVKALKFYERPSDYEKNSRLIDLKRKIADAKNASSENESQRYKELEENQQAEYLLPRVR